MEKLRVVYIEWLDASSGGPGWVPTETVTEDQSVMLVRSVGILICEDKYGVTITTSQSPELVDAPVTIPKCSIVKRRNVKL